MTNIAIQGVIRELCIRLLDIEQRTLLIRRTVQKIQSTISHNHFQN